MRFWQSHLLGFICLFHSAVGLSCRSDFGNPTESDGTEDHEVGLPKSREHYANFIFRGKVANIGVANSQGIYPATVRVDELFKGNLRTFGTREKIQVNGFSATDYREDECTGPVQKKQKYMFFVNKTEDGGYRAAGIPVKFSREEEKAVVLSVCPKCAPRVRAKTKITVSLEDSEFRMTCRADGNPIPNLVWYHNGQEVKKRKGVKLISKQNRSKMRGQLSIRFRSVKEPGTYTCVAKNKFGRAQGDTEVEVERPSIYVLCKSQSYCFNGGTCRELPDGRLRHCHCLLGAAGHRCQYRHSDTINPPTQVAEAKETTPVQENEDLKTYVMAALGAVLALLVLVLLFVGLCTRGTPHWGSHPLCCKRHTQSCDVSSHSVPHCRCALPSPCSPSLNHPSLPAPTHCFHLVPCSTVSNAPNSAADTADKVSQTADSQNQYSARIPCNNVSLRHNKGHDVTDSVPVYPSSEDDSRPERTPLVWRLESSPPPSGQKVTTPFDANGRRPSRGRLEASSATPGNTWRTHAGSSSKSALPTKDTALPAPSLDLNSVPRDQQAGIIKSNDFRSTCQSPGQGSISTGNSNHLPGMSVFPLTKSASVGPLTVFTDTPNRTFTTNGPTASISPRYTGMASVSPRYTGMASVSPINGGSIGVSSSNEMADGMSPSLEGDDSPMKKSPSLKEALQQLETLISSSGSSSPRSSHALSRVPPFPLLVPSFSPRLQPSVSDPLSGSGSFSSSSTARATPRACLPRGSTSSNCDGDNISSLHISEPDRINIVG